ncbi:MAG TPA: element excision factor XisI family protein [Blastocatellia bacterium]|nr:element excision factor XisI family protein [Blastocatellia bacterium]
MDQVEKLNSYRRALQQVIEKHARMPAEPSDSEAIAVCDPASDNYLLLDVGWEADGRVHYVIIHLRLKDGKALIEKDGIEYGVAQDLIEAGIPAEDIITAWRRSPKSTVKEPAAA